MVVRLLSHAWDLFILLYDVDVHHKLRSQKYGFFFNPMSYNPTQTAKQFRK